MSGLGGLNKSPSGVVIGMVQLQLPVVVTPADLKKQKARICEFVGKARRNLPSMDLVVFPEYSLHGLSMDTNPYRWRKVAAGQTRSSPPKFGRISCVKRVASGASRTTSTSSIIAATSRFVAEPRTAPTRSCRTWSPGSTACPGTRTSSTRTGRHAASRRRRGATEAPKRRERAPQAMKPTAPPRPPVLDLS